MRLSTRVAAGYLALVALMAVLAVHQLTVVQRLHGENLRLSGVDLEVSRAGLRFHGELETLSRLTRIYFVRRDPAYAEELESVRAEVSEDLGRLRGLPLSEAEHGALEELTAAWDGYLELAGRTEPRVAEGARSRDRLLGALATVERRLEGLEAVARRTAEERVEASARAAGRAHAAASGVTALALAGGMLLAFALARSVSRPLRRLGRGTRELAEGNFSHRVPAAGGPELEALARDFNAMADRLEELDQLKRDFVSTVSHDLKAPLASMQETTRLLLEEATGELSPDQERLLRLNLSSGERLAAMIGDLLEVARLEAGAVDFELDPEDLGELARNTVEEAGGLFESGGLRARLVMPAEPVRVAADRPLLERAVWNLLSNAAKFTRRDEGDAATGDIEVRVRTFSDREALGEVFDRPPREVSLPLASLEVRDRGPGIPDADKERVFDRFHRADRRRRGVQGTGLGLAIARGVVDGHGGHLWVEDADGGGSLFVLVLPCLEPPGRAHEGVEVEAVGRAAPAAAGRRGPSTAGLLLASALLASVLASACATPVAGPRSQVMKADRLLAAGDAGAAAQAYERHLLEAGDGSKGSDLALFRLAVLHLAPDGPVHDPDAGYALLQRLLGAHPESSLAPAARWLLDRRREQEERRAEVERLRRQLEELRRIDLDAPPPE